MKAKLKIIETPTGFRCRVCGRRFRAEEAASVHQSYDCSQNVRTMVENRKEE
jgi:transposase-like protein